MSAAEIDERKRMVSPVLALAEQLRDAPLQQLIELQARANDVAAEVVANPGAHLEELAELVRLCLAAMEHFHDFTREFQTALRDLGDAARSDH
jgi:NifB/MoaA-like Fe-S oxidoreductase